MCLVALIKARIIVRVDVRIVLSELKTRLAARKSPLIEVFVVRQNYPVEDIDSSGPAECVAISDATTAVALHVARLRMLALDVLLAASLPRVARTSQGRR